MFYECCDCYRSFDSEDKPSICLFCHSSRSFATRHVTDENGRELTYKEYIDDLRNYYLKHPPKESCLTRTDIAKMDAKALEDLDDIMSELRAIENDSWDDDF